MIEAARREHRIAAADGTRLYADDRGPLNCALTPLLCLPGLTRNSREFEPVFDLFAGGRRVLALDFRGRGKSGHADAATYRPDVEAQDTAHVLQTLGIDRVALLGTSRGGIVGLVLAATLPGLLAGLCLNDVGAKLEAEGLLRIMGYVGQPVSHPSWTVAARALAHTAHGFSNVPAAAWRAMAHRLYRQRGGRIVHTHDLALAQSLPPAEDVRAGKVPELWSLLPAVANMPVAVLRGAGSDLLAAETVERMAQVLPQLAHTSVAGRGHVPFLDEPESVAALKQWLAAVDANEKGRA